MRHLQRLRRQAGYLQEPVHHLRRHGPGAHAAGFLLRDPAVPRLRRRGREDRGALPGFQRQEKNLEVNVPAGVDTGDRIRLSGEGEPGEHGGPRGDLFVEVRIKPHTIFERDGDDLRCEVPISITQAALGDSVTVPTLEGEANMKVPGGTQSGKTFRLRGKGIKGVRSAKPGDLLCTVRVETPVNLSERQKELLRELEEEGEQGDGSHPHSKSWWEKVREFLDLLAS
ncbi:MAG: DnaJ C-terminal domain-containing protein [Thiohalorhabdaceae bacterium]